MTWLEIVAIYGIAWKVVAIGGTLGIGRWWYRTKQNNRYL